MPTYVQHYCLGWQCPVCFPNGIPVRVLSTPPEPLAPVIVPRGCICPPGAERTCQGWACPRKPLGAELKPASEGGER